MGSRYEVEITISSAKDLKNVNWRHGPLKPYAVVWVDPATKSSTRADPDRDTSPVWDEKLTIPLPNRSIRDSTLCVDVVHAGAAEGTKPLIGSARVQLGDIVDEAGIGGKWSRSLKLKRPSGRPQGKLEVKVVVRDAARGYAPPPQAAYATPYGAAPASRDYRGQYGYAPPYGAPPSGYPYSAPQPPSGYASVGGPSPAYGQGVAGYGRTSYGYEQAAPQEKKKSKAGLGTGLAVGAAAGLLGGLAVAEGVDYVENKIADDAAERVEDDAGYDDDDDDGGYGDDF